MCEFEDLDFETIIEEAKWLGMIKNEAPYIDKKPYSHNLVGLALRELNRKCGYDDKKIRKIVKDNGLDKVGWAYLLKNKPIKNTRIKTIN